MLVAARAASELRPYDQAEGRIYLTGIQALARLPIDQARRDRAAGRRTAAYISGYEGSPLAGYDLELARQLKLLDRHDIVFEPGLNEEAAAMAVQGSQLAAARSERYDGVVGYWYGKAPGLDRATDALRHANLMGAAATGGAVAFVGDDPGAKSSTVPSASEQALADLGIPTLFPADPAEILSLGLHAVAMSRVSGLWSALKIVTAVADGGVSLELGAAAQPRIQVPAGSYEHRPDGRLAPPAVAALEEDLWGKRLRIAREYAALHNLNAVTARHPGDRIGILAPGKTYLDLIEALHRLGLVEAELERWGIRLMKVGLVWPIEDTGVRGFAEGLRTVVVVEEKRELVETGVRKALAVVPDTPEVLGKHDRDGAPLFRAYGELGPETIAAGLARVLSDLGADIPSVAAYRAEVTARRERQRLSLSLTPVAVRTPYYCSGCPHSSSTTEKTKSLVGAGIGCHAMVLMMDSEQVGDIVGVTQMGGEGTHWLGMAPFVEADHLVQNLGDGTFHHSGSLAIRAAVASGRNITYRLLHNSAVAMTGGQQAVGRMTLRSMVDNLRSEGVRKIIVTSDDPRRTRREAGRQVAVWDRSRLAEAETLLAGVRGVTVLVHDQECATELRRRRKRGLAAAPRERVLVNERICEGCGDCGAVSNCLSVHPVPTEYGDKTAIHQSSCTSDRTCVQGDCPAFLTVTPGGVRRTATPASLAAKDLPALEQPGPVDRDIRLMGIGGLGVVTTTQILAVAAFLAGRHVRTLDQTGLAQKGGAVVSDVRISAEPLEQGSRLGSGDCDLYLGYDPLVAAAQANLEVLSPSATVVLSTTVVPTGAMVRDRRTGLPDAADLRGRIGARLTEGELLALDAIRAAENLFGSGQFANLMLIGVAHQCGALGLGADVVEAAIERVGIAVEKNLQAFRRGRQFVADPAAFAAAAAEPGEPPSPGDLDDLVRRRQAELVAYQDERYGQRYADLVATVRAAEAQVAPDRTELTEAVVHGFFKLLAYKDEYEVARLALDTEVRRRIEADLGHRARVTWNLHPPVLRALGMRRKLRLGPWFGVVFWILYRMRRLRGTRFDPFGRSAVRRTERRLATEYERTVRYLCRLLSPERLQPAVALARLPETVRGYEEIKIRAVADYDAARCELLGALGLDESEVSRAATAD
ncbi:indolepyruvate ferredoxin oxidoreductase family protein [Kribbella solani]|uniref:Indolepyruvate ferredoxin oxidoreductase n=1 Tax=Kribbella solani TaxID=236067 RepID=A0A841DLH7_9ACTN|nr:indolepyruvate ferredoxin oxidoreductase family protein [Kribbella solani]MBB5977287.1 indolepyruvate ferredoxin oxidoreductase [Kribbella solani]